MGCSLCGLHPSLSDALFHNSLFAPSTHRRLTPVYCTVAFLSPCLTPDCRKISICHFSGSSSPAAICQKSLLAPLSTRPPWAAVTDGSLGEIEPDGPRVRSSALITTSELPAQKSSDSSDACCRHSGRERQEERVDLVIVSHPDSYAARFGELSRTVPA